MNLLAHLWNNWSTSPNQMSLFPLLFHFFIMKFLLLSHGIGMIIFNFAPILITIFVLVFVSLSSSFAVNITLVSSCHLAVNQISIVIIIIYCNNSVIIRAWRRHVIGFSFSKYSCNHQCIPAKIIFEFFMIPLLPSSPQNHKMNNLNY